MQVYVTVDDVFLSVEVFTVFLTGWYHPLMAITDPGDCNEEAEDMR